MAIKGSKAYEIDGDKYSFAFDGNKLVGVNKVDASGDVQSNADLNAAIFQTDAVKENITEAYDVFKNKSTTSDLDFSDVEQATDSEKASYSNFQKKKYDNQQYQETEQQKAFADQEEERFYSYAGYNNPKYNFVAISDFGASEALHYLLVRDSIHGSIDDNVTLEGNHLISF